ncbi:hypothetical protein QQS21_000902 [Conoideocrella luteorostrata]|uniref:Glycosyl hydrolase family 32 N-terminal domain-containing protein n=1 Tax=Conoideocrella luteorostrata TaxID=1105319 RepID=A0AAJ0G2B1_9HYPO|nr:hypothetical protein QQS21_000902 [Conoideocrella luteorostrata]
MAASPLAEPAKARTMFAGILNVEDEIGHIRSQLDRIEHLVNVKTVQAAPTTPAPALNHGTPRPRGSIASPWASANTPSAAASPNVAVKNFPFMKIQTSSFTEMAGLGGDYGSVMVRLEQTAPLTASSATGMFVLQHGKVMTALQSFSTKIHPWYPILEDGFSACISSFMANAFERRTDTFLVLMVLASGTIAQHDSHGIALEERPDAMYLNAAMEMLHLVVLEQTIRSVQCLVAASIHYYLLLKPIQAHDLILLAIKKAQNLHISGALEHDHVRLEHWIRVYRIALLIEAELVIPLQLADSNAWETEEDIALPTGTDIWSYENDASFLPADSPGTTKSVQSDDVITYLLAEIAMRRMLRRNTTAISLGADGSAEFAPLVAKELESQLEQWFSFLPEPLRFSREFDDMHHDHSLQTPFLRTQYWACMVSFYWPAVVQVMEAKLLTETTINGCRLYFKSFREFVRSAVGALGTCLPNKWTIYASIFAISLGAYMGASSSLLTPFASQDTWDTLKLARDAFGDDCRNILDTALVALYLLQLRVAETVGFRQLKDNINPHSAILVANETGVIKGQNTMRFISNTVIAITIGIASFGSFVHSKPTQDWLLPRSSQCVRDGTTPFGVTNVGDFVKIYDPSVGEPNKWYINDHTFVHDEKSGTWHMFGITHQEPADPENEHFFAHATAPQLYGPWTKQPFALQVDPAYGETHLWAPYVVKSKDTYYMFYCGGGADEAASAINLATSKDLFHWKRAPKGPLFRDGVAARDPFVTRIGGQWVLYYCGNDKPTGGHHTVLYRTSHDLFHWSERRVAYTDPTTGTGGGVTESPWVYKHGENWYLFIGPRPSQQAYIGTDVFVSKDPFHFDVKDRVGHIRSHALELVTVAGENFVSHCGWGQGGLFLAPLVWPAEKDLQRCPVTQ